MLHIGTLGINIKHQCSFDLCHWRGNNVFYYGVSICRLIKACLDFSETLKHEEIYDLFRNMTKVKRTTIASLCS